jgi:hypothetical protein
MRTPWAEWLVRDDTDSGLREFTIVCRHGSTTSEYMAAKLGREELQFWTLCFGPDVLGRFVQGGIRRWSLLLIVTLLALEHSARYGCRCASGRAPDFWLAIDHEVEP